MPALTDRKPMLVAAMTILLGGLGGCMAAADFSYGEYQFGPGHQSARTYESRVYGDSAQGFGREVCRRVVRQEVDPFGEATVREMTVCDEQ